MAKPKLFQTHSQIIAILCIALITLSLAGISAQGAMAGQSTRPQLLARGLTDNRIRNPTAYITSQCYTQTVDDQGQSHNPCYSCHINSRVPNYINDLAVQAEYSLPAVATQNPWKNLFADRRAEVEAMADADILAYIRQANYRDADGQIILTEKLDNLPAEWDLDGDLTWNGYRPDAYFEFDDQGFDHAPDGQFTGWRAFAYYPFLGTFWPTNGSTDDVLIRLAPALRQNIAGEFDATVYALNLAIVEAMAKRRDVAILPTDETRYGVDLDKDGTLGRATHIRYDWAPNDGRDMTYVGQAQQLQQAGDLHLAAGLFPEGTEFLHSVRYLDPQDNGDIALAPHLKELRYARKGSWYTYTDLRQMARREAGEKAIDPDIVKQVPGDMERGLFSQGWRYQGFIEAADGQLRPQSKEETLFCMGCHGGIGATTDTVFSFPRKLDVDALRSGWYHWSQQGLAGLPEPRLADGTYEYTQYLQANHAGDEFRANQEVMDKFFDDGGTLKEDAIAQLHNDIGTLLLPSRQRALQLNKAYRAIVQTQSYVFGRDATVSPVENVHRAVEQNQPTEVEVVMALP
jgi:hypothetical protein